MVCSALVLSASAVDYKDFSDYELVDGKYLEAVDVVSDLGNFKGNDDGTLNPKG
ncbi:MAG: hypothetical protein GX823_03795 [Clostridiales bacterium]|nr:hypothetical protein [Clostridiales bacterium]